MKYGNAAPFACGLTLVCGVQAAGGRALCYAVGCEVQTPGGARSARLVRPCSTFCNHTQGFAAHTCDSHQ